MAQDLGGKKRAIHSIGGARLFAEKQGADKFLMIYLEQAVNIIEAHGESIDRDTSYLRDRMGEFLEEKIVSLLRSKDVREVDTSSEDAS